MLTKTLEKVIILWHLRECWNGRQARLRCVWFRRVGSSPISRTKKEADPFGSARFLCSKRESKERSDRREGKKVSGGHFLSPWESPLVCGCIRQGVDTDQIYADTYTPCGVADIFLLRWDSKI